MNKNIIIFALILLFTGCGNNGNYKMQKKYTDTPAYGDMLVDMSSSDPIILNPVIASDSASHALTGNIFSGLIKYGKDLNVECDMAESYKVYPEKNTIYFRLKKGLTFHDKTPVTMNDVKFTYERYIDDKVKTAYRSSFDNVKDVTVINDLELRVTYSKLLVTSLEGWMMGVLPEHIYKNGDFNTLKANREPVGSGPYKFNGWKTAVSVTLDAFENYHEGRPYISRLMTRIVPDQSVQFMELKSGSADLMGLTPELYLNKTGDSYFTENFVKYKIPSFSYTYMAFNIADPLFRDKKIRQAIALSINKDEIISGVMQGLALPLTGPFLPGSWSYNPDVKGYSGDPSKAAALFEASGWKKNASGLLEKNGKIFEFNLITNNANKQREESAVIIQQQLLKAGIKVNVRTYSWPVFINEFVNKKNFEAVILGWNLSIDPDNYDIWHSSKTKEGEFNFISYSNKEVDRLTVKGRETFDPASRKNIYRKMHALIAEDVPYIFLYTPYNLPIIHKRVHGISPAPIGISYNQNKWYVPAELQKYRISMEK